MVVVTFSLVVLVGYFGGGNFIFLCVVAVVVLRMVVLALMRL